MLRFIAIAIPEQHIAVAIATIGKSDFKLVSVAIEAKCYYLLQLQLSPLKVSTMANNCFNCHKYTGGKIEYGISNVDTLVCGCCAYAGTYEYEVLSNQLRFF